ncbi:cytidine deaminase [Pseudaeromonas sharmana]|uniref:Cytidine deaminase n=1 Tax=Pseudaeromonas sharmana TaxID=328412 RepID=A0ABV8CP50_9GAMM
MLATTEHVLTTLPAAWQQLLQAHARHHDLSRLPASLIEQLQSVSGLTKQELSLQLLPLAASFAYAEISHFHVGAIAWGGSGAWYLGANMEFRQQPLAQTIHAEQCAINHAWLCGETALEAITINASPCGHCRQFMNETNSAKQLQIHLPGRAQSLQQLLPDAFGPADLGIVETLLQPQLHALVAPPEGQPLLAAAWQAASQSYAPYSHAYAGVALALQDGRVICGRYAENAAFNPSLPPLQSALILLRMQGLTPEAITRAALYESAHGRLSHRVPTESLLQAYGLSTLEYLRQ